MQNVTGVVLHFPIHMQTTVDNVHVSGTSQILSTARVRGAFQE